MAVSKAKTNSTKASAIILSRAVGFFGSFPLFSATKLRSPSPFWRSRENRDEELAGQLRLLLRALKPSVACLNEPKRGRYLTWVVDVDSKIVDQAVIQAVDPTVHGELLPTCPSVLNDCCVRDGLYLVNDI